MTAADPFSLGYPPFLGRRAEGPLLVVLHFKDLGDTECCLAANAVVLDLGEYQISTATYPRGLSTRI